MCKYDTEIDENGVEVNYTTDCELYHLTSEDGEYDSKIDVHGNGTEIYNAKDSNWDEHDHIHVDEDGNVTECHGMEERDWEDKCRS